MPLAEGSGISSEPMKITQGIRGQREDHSASPVPLRADGAGHLIGKISLEKPQQVLCGAIPLLNPHTGWLSTSFGLGFSKLVSAQIWS